MRRTENNRGVYSVPTKIIDTADCNRDDHLPDHLSVPVSFCEISFFFLKYGRTNFVQILQPYGRNIRFSTNKNDL